MLVSDLIEMLAKCPPTAEVLIFTEGTIGYAQPVQIRLGAQAVIELEKIQPPKVWSNWMTTT